MGILKNSRPQHHLPFHILHLTIIPYYPPHPYNTSAPTAAAKPIPIPPALAMAVGTAIAEELTPPVAVAKKALIMLSVMAAVVGAAVAEAEPAAPC